MSFPILDFSAPAALPATLSAEGAAATSWQCVVIGAGPAGSAAALRLAAQGWRVLLIDRGSMPRPKVCGCCLSPQAMAELEQIRQEGVRVQRDSQAEAERVHNDALQFRQQTQQQCDALVSRSRQESAAIQEGANR